MSAAGSPALCLHSFLQNIPPLMVWVLRAIMGFFLEIRVGPEDQKNQRLRKSSHMTSLQGSQRIWGPTDLAFSKAFP